MLVVLDLYKIIPERLILQYVPLRNRGRYFFSAKGVKGLKSLKSYLFIYVYVRWTTVRSGSTVYKHGKINSLELIVRLEVTS